MLDLVYEEDINKALTVWSRIFPDRPLEDGLHVLLRLEEVPIGIARVTLPSADHVVLHELGIYEDLRGRGFGDFFMRSLMYMLTLCGNDFVVAWQHPYFDKFGFVRQDEGMRCKAADLVFPSACGGH